jgi:hypothetical protein
MIQVSREVSTDAVICESVSVISFDAMNNATRHSLSIVSNTHFTALGSSLWELSALSHHYYPAVATLAKSIGKLKRVSPPAILDVHFRSIEENVTCSSRRCLWWETSGLNSVQD